MAWAPKRRKGQSQEAQIKRHKGPPARSLDPEGPQTMRVLYMSSWSLSEAALGRLMKSDGGRDHPAALSSNPPNGHQELARPTCSSSAASVSASSSASAVPPPYWTPGAGTLAQPALHQLHQHQHQHLQLHPPNGQLVLAEPTWSSSGWCWIADVKLLVWLFGQSIWGPYLIFVFFSPQVQFFVQLFSTQKHVNRDKTDWTDWTLWS